MTTARRDRPATATGTPRSLGSSRWCTDVYKASMSTWRMVRGQLSGLGNALAASLPQQLVAYFRLVPRVLLYRPGVAGAAGFNPAANFVFLPPLRGKEKAFGKSPSLYRNGRSRVGEADPAMRENHPGFPSYLCGLLPFGAPVVAV